MTRTRIAGQKPLDWGWLLEKGFHKVSRFGKSALGIAQFGGTHPSAKHWKGQGPGVFEIVEDFSGDAYRAIYTVKFREVIYVLHAFQKKSPSGIRTAKDDVELVERRLKAAKIDYEARYGK